MNLLDYEIKSPLWEKLKAHHMNELNVLRERNDGSLSEIETARLRGRIGQIKAFLLLERPANSEPDDASPLAIE